MKPVRISNLPGRFPTRDGAAAAAAAVGVAELSVISEGSYRTSQDGDSLPTCNLPHRGRTGTVDYEDDSILSSENGSYHKGGGAARFVASSSIVSYEEDDDENDGGHPDAQQDQYSLRGTAGRNNRTSTRSNKSLIRLTAAAIASSSNKIFDPEKGNGTDDDSDDSEVAATKPDLSGRQEKPIPTYDSRSTRKKNLSREMSYSTAQERDENGGAARPYPSWLQALPLWLKLAVLTCLLLVIACITIGVAASLTGSPTQSSDDSSSSSLSSYTTDGFGHSNDATATKELDD